MGKLLVLIVLLFISACSSQPDPVRHQSTIHSATHLEYVSSAKTDTQLWNEVKLLQFHRQWQGTPYRYGGLTKSGLDCSGLVYIAYQDLVGPSLPRTVKGQTTLGKKINRSELQSGDLVFFKTTGSGRHVGVYLSGNRFLHVSTKKGVIISSMDNVYWKPRYWFASRI
ncbi:C40 family peptidase [Shewanella donghaensis]|uniref:C40 family peptidase n=1 Tax=Shewanella donghaensis TaxID=238836 RepID=UPI001D04086F|nr:NlpC/P60 family protein [Shewanella donghaensis]